MLYAAAQDGSWGECAASRAHTPCTVHSMGSACGRQTFGARECFDFVGEFSIAQVLELPVSGDRGPFLLSEILLVFCAWTTRAAKPAKHFAWLGFELRKEKTTPFGVDGFEPECRG